MRPPARVVLDTNVLIFALISSGPPRSVVGMCRIGDILLVTSDAILTELAEVLRRKFQWESDRVAVLLEEIRSFALVVLPGQTVQKIRGDPADNRVLECALEGRVDFIVSGDTRHLQPLDVFEGIPIISPFAFMRRVDRTHLGAPRRRAGGVQ